MIPHRNRTHRRRGHLGVQHGGDDPPIRTGVRRITGETDFIYAIRTNNLAAMREAIAAQPDIVNTLVKYKPRDIANVSPIETALQNKTLEALKLLLDSGANPNILNSNNESPLHILASNNMKMTSDELREAAEMLVARGADINIRPSASSMIELTEPIFSAIAACNVTIFNYLVINGANLNVQQAGDGYTPLMVAIEIASDFKDYPACPNFQSIIEAIINNRANLDIQSSEDKNTALHLAVNDCNADIINMLIESGANLNIQNNDGYTPLMLAFLYGEDMIHSDECPRYTEFVLNLINGGSDLSLRDADGDTILHLATYIGDVDIVRACAEKIMENGGNIHERGKLENTPLHVAALYDFGEIMGYFVAEGADINAVNGEGDTVAHLLANNGNLTMMRRFIDNGLDLNVINAAGRTPLGEAVFMNYGNVARLLINKGADVNAGSAGNTPLELAVESPHKGRIVELLVKAGATITPHILEIAHPSIKEYLLPPKMWKGFTHSDMDKFNTIFDASDAMAMVNISVCPVCLLYVERRDACNYMAHNCSEHKYYHKDLYATYKNDFGQITWCTVCGRICHGHRHYQLGPHDGPKPELAPGGDIYTNDCSRRGGGGGGGPREKIMRFRTMRRVAHELLDEVDQITHNDAMDILVQEMWLPGISPRNTEKALRERRFNDLEFPPNVAPPATQEAAPAAPVEAPPGTFEAPVVSAEPGENAISSDDTQRVITFRHKMRTGEMITHSPINKDSVVVVMGQKGPHTGFDCSIDEGCEGLLWPEEIRRAFENPGIGETITEADRAALQGYTERFNAYFTANPLPYVGAAAAAAAGHAGGAEVEDVFQQATDAVCTVPPRQQRAGAKRTTKRWKRGILLTAVKKYGRKSGTRIQRQRK